jgi:hypothetical protein
MAKSGECCGCVNADGSPRREARKGSAACRDCLAELREVAAGRMACPRYAGQPHTTCRMHADEAARMFAKLQALTERERGRGWL